VKSQAPCCIEGANQERGRSNPKEISANMLKTATKRIADWWDAQFDGMREWIGRNFGHSAYRPERHYMRGKRD
jgi:hypothetical protein